MRSSPQSTSSPPPNTSEEIDSAHLERRRRKRDRKLNKTASASTNKDLASRREKKKRRKMANACSNLAALPDVVLHDIFRRVLSHGLEHGVRLMASSKSLLSAFSSIPSLDFSAYACRKPGERLQHAVGAVLMRTTALRTLHVSLGKYDEVALWFWLRHVRPSLRELEVGLGDGGCRPHSHENHSSDSSSDSASDSDYDSDGGGGWSHGDARSKKAVGQALGSLRLPEVRSLVLQNVQLHAGYALPKLTALTLARYRFGGTDKFAKIMEGLPLLKFFRMCESNKSVVALERMTLRHPSLEVVCISNLFRGRDLMIKAPLLKSLCLHVRGDVFLMVTKNLQTVHLNGATDLTILPNVKGEFSDPKCASTEEDEDETVTGSPSLRWISLKPASTFDYDDAMTLFADTCHLETLHLEAWHPSPIDRRVGPFPILKELVVSLDDNIMDAFACQGNFPKMTKLTLRLRELQLSSSKLRSLDILLSSPQLRQVHFTNEEPWEWPSWLLQWFTSIGARHPKVGVTFGDLCMNELCCSLCDPKNPKKGEAL